MTGVSRRWVMTSGLGAIATTLALSHLKFLKITTLKLLDLLGVMEGVLNSRWRRDRLLIIGYHGVAMNDEDQHSPGIFINLDRFEKRLQLLKDLRCHVLDLNEAVRRVQDGTLPPRSVAITFDDGYADVYLKAFKVLQKYNYPVTIFMNTNYSKFNRPVFNIVCPYLFSKTSLKRVSLNGLLGIEELDLRDTAAREAAATLVKIRSAALSIEERDRLTEDLAGRLGVDYKSICDLRLFNLMSPREVGELARTGKVSFQLHGHAHVEDSDEKEFRYDIEQNRNHLEAFTGIWPTSFAFPSGKVDPPFRAWLERLGILNAFASAPPTFASRGNDPLALPRFADSGVVPDIVFKAWVTGVADFFPHRPIHRENTLPRRGGPFL